MPHSATLHIRVDEKAQATKTLAAMGLSELLNSLPINFGYHLLKVRKLEIRKYNESY